MESNLPPNNKTFASCIQKLFESTVFYSNGKILTISLILFLTCSKLLYTKWLIVITQIDIEQHGPFTLYNSNIKPDYLFWFLLQEYLLRSTYPSLKIVKTNQTFQFFYFLRDCLHQETKIAFTHLKAVFQYKFLY